MKASVASVAAAADEEEAKCEFAGPSGKMNEKYCLGHNGPESGVGYPRRRSRRSSRTVWRVWIGYKEEEDDDGAAGGWLEGAAGVSYRLGLRDCREGITTMAPGTSNLKDKHFLTFLRSAGSPSL